MTFLSLPIRQVYLRSAIVSLDDNGIIFINVKRQFRFEIQDVKDIVDAICAIGGRKKFPLLINIGEKASADKNVQEYSSKHGATQYCTAIAYITKSHFHKLALNFFILFHAPPRPTRIFTNENNAIDWLKKFI